MPEKQAAKSFCLMHSAGKITEKKPQLLRCTAPPNTFMHCQKNILFSICLHTSHESPGASLSVTRVLVPLALMEQRTEHLLLQVLPGVHMISGNNPARYRLCSTREKPKLWPFQQNSLLFPSLPMRSRGLRARLPSAYPICPTMTRCYDLYHLKV